MKILRETDSEVECAIDTYGDLLKARTLAEWEVIRENPCEIRTLRGHLAAAGFTDEEEAAHDMDALPAHLWDYQRWIIEMAFDRHRFAIFADCGLGKTAMQLEWARQVMHATHRKVLIVAPLQVVPQTIEEAEHWYGDSFVLCDVSDRGALQDWLAETVQPGGQVAITNYEKLDDMDRPLDVAGVVLDESSVLKASMGKRRTALMRAFQGVPYKLCCSATPAPNDRVEYAEHAYFLEVVRSTREFLARFFVNRGGEWKLKGHGVDAFYHHLASWSVFMRHPGAYFFADNLADLPPATAHFPPVAMTDEQIERAREFEHGDQSSLFGATPSGITSRTKMMQIAHGFLLDDKKVERFSSHKPEAIAAIANEQHGDEQVIVWVTFDEEGARLGQLIPDAAVISGKTPKPRRNALIDAFRRDEGPRVLIAKPSMLGFGLNLQSCRVQVFSTITDSFERYYQAVRRSHRYGQTRPVRIYVPLTHVDEAICTNVLSKQATWNADAERQEAAYVAKLRPQDSTEKRIVVTDPQAELDRIEGDGWTLVHGDSIAHMATMEPHSMDFSVFSPPFANLFTYSSALGDMGNVKSNPEYRVQWRMFAERLARVMRPGRNVAIHCMDIIRFAGQHGYRHTYDYPSDLRAGMEDAGFVYRARISIDKNPQIQATRTKDANLLFVTLTRNALDSHPQAGEYVLLFAAPGESETPVKAMDVTNQEWIQFAHHVWYGIRETDVLNAALGKEAEDERHICLARGSLVLTRDGYVPIEQVRAGDRVLTHEGRWQPVEAAQCIGVRPVTTIEAQGVAGLTVTPDHKLWIRAGHGARAKREAMRTDPAWIEAQETLGSYLNLKLPPIEPSPLTEREWWIVGRWLGDGHRGTARPGHGHAPIVISCAHDELPDLAANLGSHMGYVATLTASQVVVKGLRAEVVAVIDRCGRGAAGAAGKRVPAEALCLDPVKAEALLSGYLSADGHYVERRDRWTASSVSRPLLLGMAMIAQRARGVVASVYAGRGPGTTTIEGRTVQTQQDWILSFRQTPGFRPSGWIGADGAWKKVRRLASTPYAEVWNIRVAGDASFTAEGAIVKNCPLQLSLIERCVRLWSNPGETVFSPFAGIGSEGWESLAWGRKFYGVELKRSYFDTAVRFMREREQSISGRLDFAETGTP